MRPVVPESEGPSEPLSIRFPVGLKRRVDAVAEETGNDRTNTILHLIRWALDEYERQQLEEKRRSKGG